MREREKQGRAGWLLLLLLLALAAIWGQTSLRQAVGPQTSLPTYGAASGLAAGPDYAWPKRLGADSEAVFAWRHYQKGFTVLIVRRATPVFPARPRFMASKAAFIGRRRCWRVA